MKEIFQSLADGLQGDEYADIYGSGTYIAGFEAEVAEMFGKEAAVFMPSGTMAQQIALRIWCEKRDNFTVAMHPTAHPEWAEELRRDAVTMREGVEFLKIIMPDGSIAYKYTNVSTEIPFGWRGRPIASTIVNNWVLADAIGLDYFTLGEVKPAGPLVKQGGVSTNFTPWVVWLLGENFGRIMTAQLYDQGTRWGGDIPVNVAEDLKGGNFSLPANQMPSGCNIGKPCDVNIILRDSSTERLSPAFTVTLPAAAPAPVIPTDTVLTFPAVSGVYRDTFGGSTWFLGPFPPEIARASTIRLYFPGTQAGRKFLVRLLPPGALPTVSDWLNLKVYTVPANGPYEITITDFTGTAARLVGNRIITTEQLGKLDQISIHWGNPWGTGLYLNEPSGNETIPEKMEIVIPAAAKPAAGNGASSPVNEKERALQDLADALRQARIDARSSMYIVNAVAGREDAEGAANAVREMTTALVQGAIRPYFIIEALLGRTESKRKRNSECLTGLCPRP